MEIIECSTIVAWNTYVAWHAICWNVKEVKPSRSNKCSQSRYKTNLWATLQRLTVSAPNCYWKAKSRIERKLLRSLVKRQKAINWSPQELNKIQSESNACWCKKFKCICVSYASVCMTSALWCCHKNSLHLWHKSSGERHGTISIAAQSAKLTTDRLAACLIGD